MKPGRVGKLPLLLGFVALAVFGAIWLAGEYLPSAKDDPGPPTTPMPALEPGDQVAAMGSVYLVIPKPTGCELLKDADEEFSAGLRVIGNRLAGENVALAAAFAPKKAAANGGLHLVLGGEQFARQLINRPHFEVVKKRARMAMTKSEAEIFVDAAGIRGNRRSLLHSLSQMAETEQSLTFGGVGAASGASDDEQRVSLVFAMMLIKQKPLLLMIVAPAEEMPLPRLKDDMASWISAIEDANR